MPLRDFFMLKKFIVWHIHLFERHTLPIQGNRDIIWLELKTIMRGTFSCYILPLCCAFHISYVFQSQIAFLRHNQCQIFWYLYYSVKQYRCTCIWNPRRRWFSWQFECTIWQFILWFLRSIKLDAFFKYKNPKGYSVIKNKY